MAARRAAGLKVGVCDSGIGCGKPSRLTGMERAVLYGRAGGVDGLDRREVGTTMGRLWEGDEQLGRNVRGERAEAGVLKCGG